MDVRLESIQCWFDEPDGQVVSVLRLATEVELPAGSQTCLVGESGSGKTTLLNIIAGLLTPNRGRVWFGDVALDSLSAGRRDRFRAARIGFVHQGFHLLESLSALENVALQGTLAGLPRREARQRAGSLLREMGLEARLRARPAVLSMGEKQRVAIARAVINRPAVVLADEPTASLDAARSGEVLDLLEASCRAAGSSLLLVTHQASVRDRFERVLDLASLQEAAR